MSEETKAPVVQIPLEHQSAPKEHWADKEIMKAAQEIDSGQWRMPESESIALDDMPIALRCGTAAEVTRPVTAEDFGNTRNSLVLGNHPRVIDAMRRLAEERDNAPTSQEYFEKAHMLHELNERQRDSQKWDGQGRWIGKENIESRYGLLLTPIQFLTRLGAVVDKVTQLEEHEAQLNGRTLRLIRAGRLYLSRDAVKTHPEAQSARCGLWVFAGGTRIVLPGQKPKADEPHLVGTLQWPLGTEWMIMNFDEFGVPTTPKFLGWRTALLSMIRVGVITEKQANEAFPLDPCEQASWYRQQMFEWRNNRGTVN